MYKAGSPERGSTKFVPDESGSEAGSKVELKFEPSRLIVNPVAEPSQADSAGPSTQTASRD